MMSVVADKTISWVGRVGGSSYDVTEADLCDAFEAVSSVKIIKDQVAGQSRGFGFVKMPTTSEAEAAISGLNGQELRGRTLNLSEARPRTGNRPGGPGRGQGGGGRGGRRRF